MARIKDRQKAIELRKKGKTYSQIKNELKIPKSTLSDWLQDFPLTEEQINELNKNKKLSKQIAIEKTIIVKKNKREKRLKDTYIREKHNWKRLTQKELVLAGLFLYWGEGKKGMNGQVSINNTDPNVIRFALNWYINGLYVPKEKIRIDLHLYNDMNLTNELNYWSDLLNIPLAQFFKPYVKQSSRININQKGFGHGTCGLVVNNVLLKEKIMMSIKAISDYYSS